MRAKPTITKRYLQHALTGNDRLINKLPHVRHAPSAFWTLPSSICILHHRSQELEQPIQAIFLMPSTGQATSTTSTIQSIIDALADYTKVTGIDLSNNPFATAIEHSTSHEAVLELLQEREKAFKEYRDGNRRLISCLRPTVKVIQAFSGILGEADRLVSHRCDPCSSFNDLCQVPFPPANALFAGIDTLLAVRPSNTLFNRLPCDE
jgi:uncharacterized protein YqgV (UPF0045/DUF77 family)